LQVQKASDPAMRSVGSSGASMRARRLVADEAEMLRRFTVTSGIRLVHRDDSPPLAYEVEMSVVGLVRHSNGEVGESRLHRVRIDLTSEYPRTPPVCRMLTPTFHPNIDASHICVGDHWSAGEHLSDLVIRIAEMIALQAYNIRSPLDAEAAMWVDLNMDRLPIDPRSMRTLVVD
jgi:ubiquitin-protein ligase